MRPVHVGSSESLSVFNIIRCYFHVTQQLKLPPPHQQHLPCLIYHCTYPRIPWVTHQKKILRGSKKKYWEGIKKKILRVSKQQYCTYKIAANLGREVKTSAPWGIKKKILLEIHVEGRRSRNTSLRSALIFSPGSFSCRGSIFCVYTVLLWALFLSVPLFV